MLNPNVIQLRGTIFLPVTIGYSSANVEKYSSLLNGSSVLPVQPTAIIPIAPIGLQLSPEVALQENGPWQMVNGNVRIIFLPNKIDIIQDIVATKGSVESAFCAFCSETFARIVELANTTSNRMAYAPTYAKDPDDTFKSADFWGTVLRHTSFSDSDIEEVNITSNRKVEKSINGNATLINFRSVLSDAEKRTPSGIVIKGSVMISFDINTAFIPNPVIEYRASEINDFFSNARIWSDEFFDYSLS